MDPKKEAFSLIEEFKKFAFKGNVVDLAVGVIIGAAFGKIVTSLVSDIIMPMVTAFLPADQDYTTMAFQFGSQSVLYGKFLSEVLNFLIVAFALFLFIVKFLGWIMRAKKKEAEAPPPPPLTPEQKLLTEIRDLLQQRA